MNNKLFWGLVVLAAGVLVGWYVFGGNPPSISRLLPTKPSPTAAGTSRAGSASFESSGGTEVVGEKGGGAARSVVTYTDTGFAPLTVRASVGEVVTFVNESTKPMWVASAMHPTHNLLPGFDQLTSVTSGNAYEYTFTKVGTWQYHNHVNPADTGTIIITP